MPPRRKPAPPRRPDDFPTANLVTGADVRQLRALGDELERYRFVGCELSGADLTGLRFDDCLFERCNLASVRLTRVALRNVAFTDCKLIGVSFTECEEMLFTVHYDACQLRYASFVGARLAGTRFATCDLTEADFTDADLSDAVFAECNLRGTVFHHTRLGGADLTTATGFAIDPESNSLRGARFTLGGLPGLVVKYGVVIE